MHELIRKIFIQEKTEKSKYVYIGAISISLLFNLFVFFYQKCIRTQPTEQIKYFTSNLQVEFHTQNKMQQQLKKMYPILGYNDRQFETKPTKLSEIIVKSVLGRGFQFFV